MTYPDTWYSRSVADTSERPALSGSEECDSVVVGGGLAGLTTALELQRGGESVIVLEAERVGFGASGRNGGIVSPAFACSDERIEARVGRDRARDLHRLSIEGVERVRANIAEFGITAAGPVPGILHLRRYDRKDDLIAHAETFARDYGYQLDYLDRAAIRERLVTDRYHHGIGDPNAFHIHPLNYVRGLTAGLERLGGRIFEASPAVGHTLDPVRKTVRSAQGAVSARNVIFATGGYTGGLMPRLKRAILPIATYMMVSDDAPDLIASAIRTPEAVFDDRRAADYYRVTDDGRRLLWGGRITTRAANPAGVARELRQQMVGAYPQLAGLRTELAWSGLMGYSRHFMPQIGQSAPGVWHATAFGGHGLNTTAIAGKVLAEAILGQSRRIEMFAPFGLDWAGGPAGLAAAQMTYWALQLQDWWRERR